MPFPRWNDDRLDRLQNQVDGMSSTVNSVAVLREQMITLTKDLEKNSKVQEKITEQLEQAQLEPLTRARNIRSQAVIAVTAAVVGGGIAVLGALLAGAH
jgi:hypothetical protein